MKDDGYRLDLTKRPAGRFAVIDLGSNTAILLIAEPAKIPGGMQVIHEEFRIPRLSQGLRLGGELSSSAVERAAQDLRDFVKICTAQDAVLVVCGGTAPFRKAVNKTAVVQELQRQSGVAVTVLSEAQEAYCAYLSAAGEAANVVLDIGGGSCELAAGMATQMHDWYSVPLGCVDTTEQHLAPQLTLYGICDASRCRQVSELLLSRMPKLPTPAAVPARFSAVAGTPVALALLERGIRKYDPQRADGCQISHQRVRHWIEVMASTPLHEKIQRYGIPRGRAELMLSGLLILDACMQRHDFNQVTVRNAGLRFGLARQVLPAQHQ